MLSSSTVLLLVKGVGESVGSGPTLVLEGTREAEEDREDEKDEEVAGEVAR